MDELFEAWAAADERVRERHAKLMAAVERKREAERRIAAAAARQGRRSFEWGGRTVKVGEAAEAGGITQALLRAVFAEAFGEDRQQAARLLERVVAARPRRSRPSVTVSGSGSPASTGQARQRRRPTT